MTLKDKVAVITGAGSDIGRVTVNAICPGHYICASLLRNATRRSVRDLLDDPHRATGAAVATGGAV